MTAGDLDISRGTPASTAVMKLCSSEWGEMFLLTRPAWPGGRRCGSPPGGSDQTVFQLRVTLDDVVPTVWRRLLVPGAVRLAKLHQTFQAATGWTDSHLHGFAIGDQRYGMHFDDYPEGEIDETEVSVLKAVGEHAVGSTTPLKVSSPTRG